MVIIACFGDNWPDCRALEKLLGRMECGGEPELHSGSGLAATADHGSGVMVVDSQRYETRKFYK